MKQFLLIGVSAALLLGCSQQDGADNKAEAAAKEQAQRVEAEAPQKPELGDFGIDPTAMDASVRPQDDFYRWVNGEWLKTFKIPEDRSNYGVFTALAELSEKRARDIIQNAAAAGDQATDDQRKIGDLYAAFMDAGKADELGLKPLEADIAAIEAIGDLNGVADQFATQVRLGATSPFNYYVDLDSKNTDVYIPFFTQTGLGLPDRDYYLKDEPRFVELREKYVAYVAALLKAAHIEGADGKAKRVMALETEMAKAFWTRAESRNRDKTYNKYDKGQLAAAFPGFPWPRFLDEIGLAKQASVIVRQPSSLEGVSKIFAATPVEDWKAYLLFHMVDDAAPYLNQDLIDLHFAFHGTAISGIPQNRDRWKRGVGLVNALMGEAVGKIYVAQYFPPRAKAEMDKLVGNLIRAYEMRIKALDWMTEDTKKEALAKLAKFTPKIGYPDKWRDYAKLEIDRGDLIGNVKRASLFEYQRNLDKLGGPVDRSEWFMTPHTVNAYYNPSGNEIVFPAAILQPPFFDMNADPAVNYGGIGAVIGHEIGHGFDDQGRKSDGDGLLRDWWTAADAKAFQAKADMLGKQYGAYEPIKGMKINPELTMGENLGDIGGMAVAYAAYKLSLGDKEAPVIDGYGGDQRFFMGWAQVWRGLCREEEQRRRLVIDPHSPSEFRANGVVRNMDAWYKAFDVKEDDALYLPPEQRVQVW